MKAANMADFGQSGFLFSESEKIDTKIGRCYSQTSAPESFLIAALNATETARMQGHKFPEVIVADIISLDKKLDLAKDKKAALIRRRKVLAVQKVFQCTHCSLKCEKCGTQIEHDTKAGQKYRRDLRVPYNFCKECAEEYIEYIERLKGRGDSDCYWHNEAWIDAWTKWIDYQSSVDRYIKSKEFKKLIDELKQANPD